MPKIYYLVGALKKEHPVNVFGNEVTLDLVFADGMIGCCPVFDNKKDAKSYADGTFPVLAITLNEIKKGEK